MAGATLAILGIVGFFYEASFSGGQDRASALGVFEVNGWHNLLHIGTGSIGLLAFGAGSGQARRYALAVGGGYLLVAAWGFAAGDGGSLLGAVPVGKADNLLHLLTGIGGLGAGTLSSRP